MGHCTYQRSQSKFSKSNILQSLKIFFNSANSAEPDEMQHYAAFHLGLHCLPWYPFRGFQESIG